MEIHVNVVVLRQLKNAMDLTASILVVADAAAHHRSATVQAVDQVLVGAGHARPALLQKYARLDIDCPGVILSQLLNRLEPEQPHIRVDLDLGPHMSDAVQKTLLEGRLGPRVNIFRRESMLDRGGTLYMIAHHTVGLDRHAIDDHRLVEVKMALNEAR